MDDQTDALPDGTGSPTAGDPSDAAGAPEPSPAGDPGTVDDMADDVPAGADDDAPLWWDVGARLRPWFVDDLASPWLQVLRTSVYFGLGLAWVGGRVLPMLAPTGDAPLTVRQALSGAAVFAVVYAVPALGWTWFQRRRNTSSS